MKRACLGFALLAIVGGAVASVVASTSPDALEHLTEAIPSRPYPIRAPFADLPPPLAGMAGVVVTLALVTIAARPLAGSTRPLDARIKIALAVTWAALVSTVPLESTWKLAVFAGLALVAAAVLRPPLRRMKPVVGAFALAGLGALAWVLAEGRDGFARGALLVAKVVLSAFALALLLHTTSPSELWRGLRGFGMPRPLVLSIALLERSIVALGEEARRLALALKARGAFARPRLAGAALGSLFARTLTRSERVGLAMEARGFDPAREAPPLPRLDPADAAFAGAMALLLLLVAWW